MGARFLLGSVMVTWAILGFARMAPAIIVRPDRDDRVYRELADRFPAVCWILDDNPRGTNHGTGTLIAPRWVLVAAHVVDGGTKVVGGKLVDAHGPTPTRVEFGKDSYRIRRIVLCPSYKPTSFDEGQCDIALVELVDPVQNVTPIPIHVKSDELGRLAHLVGFGWTGTFETGQPPAEGSMTSYFAAVPCKRAATNIVDAIDGHLLITTIDPLSSATELEGSLATADSGGPLLIEVDGGYLVAGVASMHYGDEAKHQRFGGQDAFTRVSDYSHWIEQVTGEDFGAPMTTMAWVLISVAVVLACGLAVRRRGKRFASFPDDAGSVRATL
jgi:secreted trypsin-like serine protease